MPDTPARLATWSRFGKQARTDDTAEISPISEAMDVAPDPAEGTPPLPRCDDARGDDAQCDDPQGGDPGNRGGALRRSGITMAVALGLLALVYGIDLAMSHDDVPRGVTVAGVDVGGMQRTAAEQRLRERLEPRLNHPLALQAGDVSTTLDPVRAGLTLDWPGTLDQAGAQPLNPWTRLASLWRSREVGVATSGNRTALAAALEGLRTQADREPVEGTIRFDGARPIPVDPKPGQRLDVPAATNVVLAVWVRGGTVRVPVATLPVSTTPDGVQATLRDVVEPAVSGPVTVTGDGKDAVLTPEIIAAALRFAPDGQGGLTTTIDDPTVIAALEPQLASTQRPGKNAEILIQGGAPVVLPSVDGRSIDWAASVRPLRDVLRISGRERTMAASYVTLPPKLSTEQAHALGITTQISTFTTGGFAPDSGQNIRRVAEQVNGAIVRPGQTFSLNGHTGPRNAAAGYVEAGIIDHGRPGRGIGGGISQFATTIYNASYFAGMTDIEHKEHSYYISRYPAAREATVFEGAIDVRFRDDSPTGVLIQTAWTPTSITVTFWGTKHVDVESITGPRTNITEPKTQTIYGQPCTSSRGSQGFTVTDTRVIRDANTKAEISRRTRAVVYDPQPRVICA
ncbi:MAG TPA: VanW family protein [Pseudonocardiaceae bacterium]|nr:VanW family protein [Pseudonocardiaceae bacterium]